MISLSIGKTLNSLKEIKFNPNDEIILELIPRFVSTDPFIKKERKGRKNAVKRLALYRIICEDGIFKEKTPNVPLPINYTEEDYGKSQTELLDMVSNNANYITKPLKIKVKDVIKIPKSQLENFWRYKVPLPEINSPSLLTEFQMRISYYLGYWLGDGTSSCPGALTIGKDDQPEAEIVLKQLSKELNLKLTMGRNKKGLTCTLNKGKTCGNITAACLDKDWLKNITAACEELEIAKNTLSPHINFKSLYDPVKQYKKGNDYYYDDGNGRKFNTEHIENKRKKREGNRKKNRFVHYMRETVKVDVPYSTEIWSSMSLEEQNKYKLGPNKKDIIKKYKNKMRINSPVLTEYYKIWLADKNNGLQNIINEQIKSISPIFLEFNKLNLIGNKHIPEIYFTAPIEIRKQLLAGLIDSDGCKAKGMCWSLSQSIAHKRIIDDTERLANSLGHFTRRKERISKYTHKGVKKQKPSIRLSISPYYNFDIPLIYERKRLDGNTTQLPIIIHNYETKEIIKHVKEYPTYITYYEDRDGFSIGNEFTHKWSISSKNIDHDIKLDFAIKIANCLDSSGIIEGKENEIENIYTEWQTLLKKTLARLNRENWGKNLVKNGKIIGYTIKRKMKPLGGKGQKSNTFKFAKSDSKFDHSKIECKTLEECKKLCYLWYDSFDSEENNIKYERELAKISL